MHWQRCCCCAGVRVQVCAAAHHEHGAPAAQAAPVARVQPAMDLHHLAPVLPIQVRACACAPSAPPLQHALQSHTAAGASGRCPSCARLHARTSCTRLPRSFLFEEKLDLKKRYVLYELPHGTFPIGPVTAATMVQSLFAGAPIYSLAASSVFSIPFW